MANTTIQIKRSQTSAAPATLNIGELAYSYTSNTLYIGNTGGTGVIAIGGASLGIGANAYAAAVGVSANSFASAVGVSANSYAAAVGVSANAFATTIGTAGNNYTNAVGTAGNNYTNSVGTAGNNYTNAVGVAGNNYSASLWTNALINANNTANSANAVASATYYSKSGGTVSGDVAITGNLTVSGQTTYANTGTLLVGDNIITLNADIPGTMSPIENAGIEVNRGSKNANASLLWIESANAWAFTSNNLLGISTYIASNTDVVNAGTGANNYAAAAAVSANSYAAAAAVSANSYAAAAAVSANAFATTIGASSNNWANTKVSSVTGTAGQIFSSGGTTPTLNLVNTSVVSSTYGGATQIPVFTVDGQGRLTYAANVTVTTVGMDYPFANGVANSANAYAAQVAGYANTNAANGSYITTGTVVVARGGTGNTTFLANSVLIGAGTNPVWGLFSSTEGQLLQVSSAGAPQFAMLDGGSF